MTKSAAFGNDAGVTRLLRTAVQLAESLGASLDRQDREGMVARFV